MTKICEKNGCHDIAINREKYCIRHRIKLKRNQKNENDLEKAINLSSISYNTEMNDIERAIKLSTLSFEKETKSKNIENSKKLEEDRLLKKQQELEYLECLEYDKKKLQSLNEKKLEEQNKVKLINKLKEKYNKIEDENDINNFKIKIKLPNCSIIRIFNNKVTIQDIREYIDLYLYENNINIINYDLISINPNKKFDKTSNLEINNLGFPRNFCLFLQNLDN